MADYISQFTGSEIDSRLAKVPQIESALEGKQATLVSGTNIKTINGQPVLGSGDMTIQVGDTDAVKYVSQTLTEEQKAQARANIDAASLADIADMDFVTATTLPTASASTMGHIYLIGPDANDNYDRYFTQESGGSYSWVSLGSTQIDLSTYATQAEVSQLEAEVDEKFDREQNTDTLCIVDGFGNIIAQIDADGVNTVDVRVKIDGELVSVKSLLANLNEGVSTLNEGLATEKLRAETEEAKKLDKVIDDDALVIMDENGYIIVRIDASGIHSAQDKHAVACMVLGESYYPTSAPTRDSSGNITHANVMFGTGVAGSLDITYANNNASQVVAHYGSYTYTISITRDADGNVQVVTVN